MAFLILNEIILIQVIVLHVTVLSGNLSSFTFLLLSTTGILAEGLDISGKTRKCDLHFIFTLVALDLLTHLALIFPGFEKLLKSVDFNEDAILDCKIFLQKPIFDL